MIGADRLTAAFEPYAEAMGSLEFAAHMAGFEPLELMLFASQHTAGIARTAERALREKRRAVHANLIAGVFAVGVLVGAACVRQEASA